MGKVGDTLKAILNNAVGAAHNDSTSPQPQMPTPSPNDTSEASVSGDPLANLYGNDGSPLGMLLPQTQPQAAQQVPQGVNPAALQDNPYGVNTPNTPQDISGTPDQTGDPATVVGDRWQPKHENILQKIGDLFLGNAFHRGMDNRNLISALHNFQGDPETAIKRVETFNPEAAWKMQQQYDTTHGDDDYKTQRSDYIKTENDQRALETAAGMMGAVQNSGDPEAAFTKIGPVIKNYLTKHGVDTEDFPTDYDPDKLNAFMLSAVKPKDQIDQNNLNNYRGKRLNQMGTAISNTAEYRAQRLQQLQGNMTERQRHDQAVEGKGIPKVGARDMSTDRSVMAEFRADGLWHIFKKVNGKVSEIGVRAPRNVTGSKIDTSAYDDTPVDDEDQ